MAGNDCDNTRLDDELVTASSVDAPVVTGAAVDGAELAPWVGAVKVTVTKVPFVLSMTAGT